MDSREGSTGNQERMGIQIKPQKATDESPEIRKSFFGRAADRASSANAGSETPRSCAANALAPLE